MPQSGSVTACYQNALATGGDGARIYATSGLVQGANAGTHWHSDGGDGCTPTTSATTWQATNCYDNGGNNGGTQQYSITQNANLQNCALSFKFQ